MGMAASQVRLLMLTARMHDIEYKAQSIQNAKLQLATQSDEVYKEYLNALDAKTLTIASVDGQVVTANFNNLCGRNAIELAGKDGVNRLGIALYDEKGRLIVTDDMFELYNKFGKGSDPYAFALFALTGKSIDLEDLNEAEYEFMDAESTDALKAYGNDLKDLLNKISSNGNSDAKYEYGDIVTFEDMEREIYTCYPDRNENDTNYKKCMEILNNYKAAEKNFRYKLYRNPENVENIFTRLGNQTLLFV